MKFAVGLSVLLSVIWAGDAFVPTANRLLVSTPSRFMAMSDESDAEQEAERLRNQAESLREQIRKMEEKMGPKRTSNNNEEYIPKAKEPEFPEETGKSLRGKTVLVVGSNGRLGSMVTRHLLRNHPEVKEVVAAVHYVGQATSRGYGRLSYEVGAEDGVGTIGAAWSEDRNASFEYADYMKDYNLNKLRVMEVELLDPVQCMTLAEGVDSVIYCASDFDGNRPRAIASLNAAFLFRAIAAPTKGRVEIEGLTNMLGALKESNQNRIRIARMSGEEEAINEASTDNRPTSFVLVSSSPNALGNFETPFGEFNGLKRQGEGVLRDDFPSLTHSILQFGKFDDNFVEESLDIQFDSENILEPEELSKRRINRRDAARAAVEALTDENLVDKTVQVWTATGRR